MILALADREVDKVHRTLGCNDRVHVLVAVVVDLPSDLRPGRRDLKLRAVASLAAEEVQPWLRIECDLGTGDLQRIRPERVLVGDEPDSVLHPAEPAGIALERVRPRHLAHGQLTERAVRQGDPPRPVLADLHRVPEAPVEVVELLRGVVRVDVDSPDDVAGDYTVALEGRTGDRRGDAVDLV